MHETRRRDLSPPDPFSISTWLTPKLLATPNLVASNDLCLVLFIFKSSDRPIVTQVEMFASAMHVRLILCHL